MPWRSTGHASGRGRAARGPVVGPRRPADRRGRARPQRARLPAALPRRPRAGRARRGDRAGPAGSSAEPWSLQDPECAELLGWAARLHEVGLDIAHAQHQLHAAYLLRNADLAGFSFDQQRRLAVLVGAHRRKIRDELLDGLQEPWSKRMPHLLTILRLAVLLHRSRGPSPPPPLGITATRRKLRLQFPAGWLESPSADPRGPRAGGALPGGARPEAQLSLTDWASSARRVSWAETGAASSGVHPPPAAVGLHLPGLPVVAQARARGPPQAGAAAPLARDREIQISTRLKKLRSIQSALDR
jgi:hypothetical protein